jgi:hypothetical protein
MSLTSGIQFLVHGPWSLIWVLLPPRAHHKTELGMIRRKCLDISSTIPARRVSFHSFGVAEVAVLARRRDGQTFVRRSDITKDYFFVFFPLNIFQSIDDVDDDTCLGRGSRFTCYRW